jgi:hypothetical protein
MLNAALDGRPLTEVVTTDLQTLWLHFVPADPN